MFIIGNGFDLSHNLPTSYADFQKYLKRTYPDAKEDLLAPESVIMPDGGEAYDDSDVVGFLLMLITETEGTGEEWNDLEETLGKLDFNECFPWWSEEEEENEWYKVYRNEEIAANIKGAVELIKLYFSDWIKTIDICSTPKVNFNNLIDHDNDLFLSFNYTETLEKIYNVSNVCHIHGMRGRNDTIVLGHGNDENYYDEYMVSNVGSEGYLSELQASLRKDTKSIISKNKSLFKSFRKVDKIYSYGFSFADVDMVYIREICNVLEKEDIVWYLSGYDDEATRKFYQEKIVKNGGFKGKFDIFTI